MLLTSDAADATLKVADLGLCLVTDAPGGAMRSAAAVGTWAYSSPEKVRPTADGYTEKTDVWCAAAAAAAPRCAAPRALPRP